jgi:hypothetical protein
MGVILECFSRIILLSLIQGCFLKTLRSKGVNWVLLKRARLNLGSDIRVHKFLFWLPLVVKVVDAIYFLCNDRVLMSCVMIRIPRLIKVFLECIVILKYSKLDDILMVLVSLPHRNEPWRRLSWVRVFLRIVFIDASTTFFFVQLFLIFLGLVKVRVSL